MANISQRGKKNQANGHRFEILVWNRWRKKKSTLASAISSGSKGLVDVWILEKKRLLLIICKSNGYLEPIERQQINAFLLEKNKFIKLELWYYKSKRKIGKLYLEKGWEERYGKKNMGQSYC